MIRTRVRFLRMALFCFVTMHTRMSGANEVRTWTDSTGKHKVEAEFVEILDGKVRLKLADGKIVSLPLAKVSEADREYLKEVQRLRKETETEAEANAPSAAEDSGADEFGGFGFPEMSDAMADALAHAPPEVREHMLSMQSRRRGMGGPGRNQEMKFNVGDKVEVKESSAWEIGEVTVVDPQWNRYEVRVAEDGRRVEARSSFDIRSYDPSKAAPGDNARLAEVKGRIPVILPSRRAAGPFAPDPAPGAPAPWEPQAVVLAPRGDYHEDIVSASFSEAGARAVLGFTLSLGDEDEGQSRVVVCDLKSGQVTAEMIGPRNLAFGALSPSGRRLATASELEAFVHGPVKVWEFGATDLRLVTGWQAHQRDQFYGKLDWLGWTDESHLMTVSRGMATLWSVEGPRGVYQMQVGLIARPTFSPGGKQFAIRGETGFTIHDVASGKLLAQVSIEDTTANEAAAFSPSGKLLAVSEGPSVDVYDIATDKKIMSAYSGAGYGPEMQVHWLSEDLVLVGGEDLIHLPSQMRIWTYDHSFDWPTQCAGQMWYVDLERDGERGALLPFKLPQEGVGAISESELVLKPGDAVSTEFELNVSIASGVEGVAASPQDQLNEAVRHAGFVVADNSNKRLVARSLTGETKEINFQTFGAPRGEVQTASATQRVFELELFVDGKSVWMRRRVHDAPYILNLEENESVEQGLQRYMEGDIGFFHAAIPSRIVPKAAEEARISKLTRSGMN
jgi:hypothetical protein